MKEEEIIMPDFESETAFQRFVHEHLRTFSRGDAERLAKKLGATKQGERKINKSDSWPFSVTYFNKDMQEVYWFCICTQDGQRITPEPRIWGKDRLKDLKITDLK